MEKAMKNKIDRAELLKLVYDAVLGEPDIEGFFNMIFCSKRFRRDWNVEEMIENAIQISKPIFFWLIGEAEEVQYISQLLAKYNIPSFTNLEEMVKSWLILVQESRNKNQNQK